jgi:hypothetical protein
MILLGCGFRGILGPEVSSPAHFFKDIHLIEIKLLKMFESSSSWERQSQTENKLRPISMTK